MDFGFGHGCNEYGLGVHGFVEARHCRALTALELFEICAMQVGRLGEKRLRAWA